MYEITYSLLKQASLILLASVRKKKDMSRRITIFLD